MEDIISEEREKEIKGIGRKVLHSITETDLTPVEICLLFEALLKASEKALIATTVSDILFDSLLGHTTDEEDK